MTLTDGGTFIHVYIYSFVARQTRPFPTFLRASDTPVSYF